MAQKGLSRAAEFNGCVDPLESMFINENSEVIFSAEKNVCLDVGANNGYYSCLFASLDCRVFAFEPMPEFYDELLLNIRLNGFDDKIALQKFAVSDQAGTLYMNSGLVVPDAALDDGITCNVINLDDWCEKYKLTEDIAFIKIDVEGLEEKVVSGASEVIDRARPALLIEIAPYMMGDFGGSAKTIFDSLAEKGYMAYQVPYPVLLKKRQQFIPIDSFESIKFSKGINFLFLPSDFDSLSFPVFEMVSGYVHYQPFSAVRRFIQSYISFFKSS